jgi:hypothetical protein
MITYVNTVLVTNENAAVLSAAPAAASSMTAASADKGKFVIMNCDPDAASGDLYTIDANTKRIKIGIVTGKNFAKRDRNGSVTYLPIVKWSNIINKDDIRSFHKMSYFQDTEDVVTIDFSNMGTEVANTLKLGEKRIIVRLTFKDLPTRFRKWTESYEYVTKTGDTAQTIATGIANLINSQWKRARVIAQAASGVVTLTAMPYDDDDANDTINWAAKVRFNANVYYTDPTAAAFASRNKYFIDGVTINKTPGKQYAASAKLVRDRESKALGYEGILNRGCSTWPIIKPDMVTDITKTYDALTLEFENMYRAADDIFRKTKQTVEMYVPAGSLSALETALTPFAGAPVSNGITA